MKIFVFSSNQAGIHARGSALYAFEHFGAQHGVFEGLNNSSYAILTQGADYEPLPINTIAESINRFKTFARTHCDWTFQVTEIGSDIAKIDHALIGPYFSDAPKNCILPISFLPDSPCPTPVGTYAGIGSRKTPEPVLKYMRRLAYRLAELGFLLRSGAASGADTAFEDGCFAANGQSEIWLPWKNFNNHLDTIYKPNREHFHIAKRIHPAWENLARGPRALHSRNIGQILGLDLVSPVDFVVCWTPDGCICSQDRKSTTGGTGTAIAVASDHGIPVFNLANPNAVQNINAFVLEKLNLIAQTT